MNSCWLLTDGTWGNKAKQQSPGVTARVCQHAQPALRVVSEAAFSRCSSVVSIRCDRANRNADVKDTERRRRRFPCIECDSESMRLLPPRNYPVASDQGGSCWMSFNIQSQISDESVCHTNQHLPAAKHVSKLKIKKDNSRVINILPRLADFPHEEKHGCALKNKSAGREKSQIPPTSSPTFSNFFGTNSINYTDIFQNQTNF